MNGSRGKRLRAKEEVGDSLIYRGKSHSGWLIIPASEGVANYPPFLHPKEDSLVKDVNCQDLTCLLVGGGPHCESTLWESGPDGRG